MIIKVERCDKRFRLIYRNFNHDFIEWVSNPFNDKWDNGFAKQANLEVQNIGGRQVPIVKATNDNGRKVIPAKGK